LVLVRLHNFILDLKKISKGKCGLG
jgi:hypothetical protein